MSLLWVRGSIVNTISTAGIGSTVKEIYNNQKDTVTTLVLVQKVTVVATYLHCITDTDDTHSVRLIVLPEQDVPTAGFPTLDDGEVKGVYPFSRGPVLYNPKRLIDVPTEYKLFLTTYKEDGSTASISRVFYNVLLNLSFKT